MAEAVARREPWWSLLLRGVLIIIFALMALTWPGITLLPLTIFFGAFLLIDGLFTTGVSVVKRDEHKHWWLVLLGGLAGIVIGSLTFVGLAAGGVGVFYLMAAWLVVTGIIRMATATRAGEEGANRLPLTLGIVSVLFGATIFMMSISIPAALATFRIIALFAMLIGILLLADAFTEQKRIRETSPLET